MFTGQLMHELRSGMMLDDASRVVKSGKEN